MNLSDDPKLWLDITRQLAVGAVGVIYLDTIDYAGLERSTGSSFCASIVQTCRLFMHELQAENPSIMAFRQLNHDLFVFAAITPKEQGFAAYQLSELTQMVKRRVEEQLRKVFGANAGIEAYVGHSLLHEPHLNEQNVERIVYQAMKQAIRRVNAPVNLAEDRSQWNEFASILQERKISSVYQPIVSLADAGIFGFEALTRGPSGSVFHSPMELFGFAERHDALYTLDKLAREKAIEGCKTLRQDQRVFINIPAQVIHDPQFTPGKTLRLLKQQGIQPHNVVLEITERTSIEDFSTAKKILAHYRSQGYQIAIDDAGAGYSSLQAIAELQPDFIKVDRSLIQNIHVDKIKEMILETFVSFARKMSIRIIAEGIETWDELKKLSQMGVHYGQGYLLGRPAPEQKGLTNDIEASIERINRVQGLHSVMQIGNLSAPIRNFEHTTPISEVANYFKQNEDTAGTVILKQQQPVGLIMRERLFQQLAGQYGVSLYWNRPIRQLMDPYPLIVEETVPIEQVSQMAMSRDKAKLYDLVVITSRDKMMGVASIQKILESITNARMETARVANPLTGLPGNTQINRELNKRLFDGQPFSVIYADLDYFKWFNDRCGFQKGDQLIQFTAEVLQQATSACGHPHDFVGHIGGDDFIVITAASDPHMLCKEIIRRFEQGVGMFYEEEEFRDAQDRQGNRVDVDGVTISLSLVICESCSNVTLEQISQTAAVVKKQAKAQRGSVYVCKVLQSASFIASAGEP